MTIHLIIAAAALMLLALNLRASFVLARTDCYERKQKLMQYFLVWLFPIAGGILVWALASQSYGYAGGAPSHGKGVTPCRNEQTDWTGSSSGGGWN